MTGWTKAWIAWVVCTIASFLTIEIRGLKVPGATLSEHLRTGFGFDHLGPAHKTRRGIFYILWGWFGLHILGQTAGCVPNPLSNVIPGE